MGVGRIEAAVHGGDLAAARLRYPSAAEPWVDLSTGINPHAYPVPTLGADVWQRLPQSDAEHRLLHAAAQRYGAADAGSVVAAPGSQALIQIIPRLLEPSGVAVLGPTYGEHAASWARCGHRVAERRGLAEIGVASIVVVVNPNNPTGRTIAADELSALAAVLAQRGGLLVVDEAFADFAAPGVSIVPHLPPATVVLRSFGKAYGLAGLRLGFAIAHPGLCRAVRAELGPWAVSGPAAEVAAAALADAHWLADVGGRLADDCRRLDELLLMHGFELEGGTQLFRLAKHRRATVIADVLGGAGIHVRRFPAQPSWLRFGLPGTDEQWWRLAAALSAAAERT
ncbi:threonine-phosphate decarboxylase CobD [Hyphomicrobium sp.]|nr:threonine-phosphate decarboxylase CobD [Hyphomicrobium sp.]